MNAASCAYVFATLLDAGHGSLSVKASIALPKPHDWCSVKRIAKSRSARSTLIIDRLITVDFKDVIFQT